MNRITRRGLLGKTAQGSAIAVAATAVASVPVLAAPGEQPGPGELIHPAECYHRKYSAPEDNAQYSAIWQELMDTTTDHQRHLLIRLDGEIGRSWLNEQDRYITELARHFPGLAPAIRAVAYHLDQGEQADRGGCCSGEVTS